MNGLLPPVDPGLREQLARRSTGRPPDGLLTDISRALDAAPEPRAWFMWPRIGRRSPRLAVAGVAVAFVAVLVVAIAMPSWRAGPASAFAGYPADRALTTAELASLMAGPRLPADTALVAAVTIDARTDVCPMNRYPTIGVLEGMASQVCVMGPDITSYLGEPKATGTFAFRYLAPGILGLVGQITPESTSKLAFEAAADWPLRGETFLVQGWLGAEGTTASCATAPIAGDPLKPSGDDCPYLDWLGADSTAPGIEADSQYNPASPTADPLSLRGNAHHVEAGGMRLIDSVDPTAPSYGVYVVRSYSEPCPGDPPTSSRECIAWHVLAKVADAPEPAPSASSSAAATSAPPATPSLQPSGPLAPSPVGLLGSGDRPLTEDEFASLWAADPSHLAGRTAIVKGPVPSGFECSNAGAVEASASSQACHVATLDGTIAADGYWAVEVGSDRKLSITGEVVTPSADFVYSYDEAMNSGIYRGGLVMVDAWLDWQPSLECDTPPYPSDSLCGAGAVTSYLTGTKLDWSYSASLGTPVQMGAYQIFGSVDLNARPIHAVYLIQWSSAGVTILARLEAAPGA
jgi:hypothetical protein